MRWFRRLIPTVVIGIGCVVATSFAADKPEPRTPVRNAVPPEMKAVLENSTQLILLSVDPLPAFVKALPNRPTDSFHNHAVLGRVEIKDKAQRASLLRALYQGIGESDGRTVYACFNPRHAIHATDGKTTVDLLICFECLQVYTYSDGGEGMLTTTNSPQKTFDDALRAAGVPLSTPN